MRNKLVYGSLILGAVATLLGIISTTGINDERAALSAFHMGSTALFLGLMSVLTLLAAKTVKE